ncbi:MULTISPECIES: potassium transporter Kup [Rhizobium/Agrobacterium group]|uniref:potassium transporter Kup n=1 Tax=Rhizobium/Agrobacterium group TaxID=227290 RepID=UPI00110EE1A1|nr:MULTISPECIES: potassium transporter Kup [Rhizobium/Agrobacterium group]NWJ23915.1 potassium transporter Kup [Rhizobium sp. RM]TMV11222.1 potassium transporter Kup [Rhizobium sp. Td3]UXS04739.1 potassium transporter Kup [Agrobacterium tumefaciens]
MTSSNSQVSGTRSETRKFLVLLLGSIGVVYGDIGTSPLYAFRESLRPFTANGVQHEHVVGLISLMIWTLTIIVTFKYVLFLLRADNDGEGGTLSLLALLMKKTGSYMPVLFFAGLVGSALFIGDAMITPALSVMSALEGMKLVTPAFSDYVLPLSALIMVGLFAVQSKGTGAVAKFFGPITVVWFLAMAWGGLIHIGDDWTILEALNPINALWFITHAGWAGLIVLGAVFLTVTGAEALYADLGHFGRKPISAAWFILVFPALALNYLGQGALVLSTPAAIENPFYLLYPEWALLPMVILATMATVIASQAVITGAFSLARQAVHLGFLPKLMIRFTSETNTGQIYVPAVNMVLFIGVLVLIFSFGDSESLATAYGISVTGAMVVTTLMAFQFLRSVRGRSAFTAAILLAPLFAIEAVFLAANLLKVHDGGWVPLALAGVIILVMWTWTKGSRYLREKIARNDIPLDTFITSLEGSINRGSRNAPVLVPGTAVFLTSVPDKAPGVLLHNLKHNHVLHEQNVILTIWTHDKPYISNSERVEITRISKHFMRLDMNFGFMDDPNVVKALPLCKKKGFKFEIMQTSFYLGRRNLIATPNTGLPWWQEDLYIALAGIGIDPSAYFNLPPNRVIELGEQVAI